MLAGLPSSAKIFALLLTPTPFGRNSCRPITGTISRAVEFPSSSLNFASKKDLYLRLCDSLLLIDDGQLSFWLDKQTGKKCYMIAARALHITWGDTPRYWQWISKPESGGCRVVRCLVARNPGSHKD